MIINTTAIAEDKIKTRWEEPYVSSAINRIASALPRGIYRGFSVEPFATPASGFQVKIDTGADSFLVFRDLASGYCTAVQFDADFDMYFTFSLSTWYYVWLEVDYQVSSTTTASIKVGEAADLASAGVNALVLAKFYSTDGTLDPGDILTDKDLGYSIDPRPDGTMNAWGLIDKTRWDRIPNQAEKDGLDAASPPPSTSNPYLTDANLNSTVWAEPSPQVVAVSPPASQCQLTGFFYVGKGSSANQWFQLMDPTSNNGLTDDVDGSQCVVAAVYDSTDSHSLVPSAEADADGFYENPIIKFSNTLSDPGQTSVGVFCGKKSIYSGLPNTALIQQNLGIYAPIHQTALDWMKRNTDRIPTTLTVDATGTTLANYSGANALYAALLVLGNSTGGTIFVRKGDYTLTNAVTTTKPLKIICEGHGQVAGERCRLTIQSGGSLTFNAPVVINDIDIDVDHNAGSTPLVKFNGGDTSVIDSFCNGMMAIDANSSDYYFRNLRVELTNTPLQACFMIGHATSGCIVQDLRFVDCHFNPTNGDTVNGHGFLGRGALANALLYNATFDGCFFLGRGNAYRAFHGYGYSIQVNRCSVGMKPAGGAQQTIAAFDLGTPGGFVNSVKDLTVSMGTDGADINCPAVYIHCDGDNATTTVENLLVGSQTNKPLSMAASVGFVYLDAGGTGTQGTLIDVRGLSFLFLEPAIVSGDGDVVVVRCVDESSRINIRGLIMEDFKDATVNAWLRAVSIRDAGQGNVLIDGSVLDGTTLTSTAGQNFVGIAAANANGSLNVPGGLTIRDSTIKGFELKDIDIESNTRIVMDGVRGDGDSMTTAGTRWEIDSPDPVITRCWFSNDVQQLTILNLLGGADRPIVSNNHLFENVGGTGVAIFASSGTTAGAFIGNVGAGQATSYTVSNHLGWGDSVGIPANQSPYILNIGFTITIS